MLPPPNYAKRGRDNRLRSPAHLAFVRKRLCIAWEHGNCYGRIEAAHCRDIAPNGHGGGKPDDCWVISVCTKHHRESEKRERAWGAEYSIDVAAACIEYAAASPDRAVRAKVPEMKAHVEKS
ncbi:MAG: hypothetical protein KGL39_07760 [Patescibacteria group bacterium]|nr:hypothetical protein [Patescibacteria group bacterium]